MYNYIKNFLIMKTLIRKIKKYIFGFRIKNKQEKDCAARCNINKLEMFGINFSNKIKV